MQQLFEISDQYGYRFAVCQHTRASREYKKPNFLRSGFALVGKLNGSETLEQFSERLQRIKKEVKKRVSEMPDTAFLK